MEIPHKEEENNDEEDERKRVYIRDVDGFQAWPEHIHNHLNTCTEPKIHFAEIISKLAQICIVEAGLVPNSPSTTDISPSILANLTDYDRVPMLVPMIPADSYKSNVGIFTCEFLPILKEIKYEVVEGGNEEINDRYFYGNKVKIILMDSKEIGNIDAYGTYEDEKQLKSLTHNSSIDIQSCLQISSVTTDEFSKSTKYSVDEWKEKVHINGPRLSSVFKTKFVLPLMDLIGALTFETRGIQNLPPEMINMILKFCNIRSILNTRLTSKYFRDVINNPSFWNDIILRDFAAKGKDKIVKRIEELRILGKPPTLQSLIQLYQEYYKENRIRRRIIGLLR